MFFFIQKFYFLVPFQVFIFIFILCLVIYFGLFVAKIEGWEFIYLENSAFVYIFLLFLGVVKITLKQISIKIKTSNPSFVNHAFFLKFYAS